MLRVSIIVPVYNKEKYLRMTINSLLNQKYENFEVIFVNDGSTDLSRNVIVESIHGDTRFVIVDIPNGGVSNARNVGLKYATGDWIQFLDADDLIDAEYLLQVVDLIEVNDVDIVFSNFYMINKKRERLRKIEVQKSGEIDRSELCDSFMETQYCNGYYGYISNKIFNRKLLENSAAHFPDDISLAEDLNFFVQLYSSVEKGYLWEGISFYYLQTEKNYLNNLKIDYYSQMKNHLQIRKWVLSVPPCHKYREVVDKKVCDYVYHILYWSNERNENMSSAMKFIMNNQEIYQCINISDRTGFQKIVLAAVKLKLTFVVKFLFKSRDIVRTYYRKAKNNE